MEDQINDSASGIQMSEQLAASLAVLRRRWLVVVLVPVLAVIVSLAVSLHGAKRYTATAKVTVAPLNTVASTIDPGSQVNSADPERDLNTAVSAITETPMAALVRSTLKTPESAGSLIGQVDAELEGTTNIVDITATDGDPARAAQIANTFARDYVGYSLRAEQKPFQQAVNGDRAQLRELTTAQRSGPAGLSDEADLQKLQESLAVMTSNATVSQTATAPSSPSSPKPSKDAIIALIVGLLIGIVAAIVLELFDRTVRDEEDASALTKLRSLGSIPRPHLHAPANPRPLASGLSLAKLRSLRPPTAQSLQALKARTAATIEASRAGAKPANAALAATSVRLGSRDWELAESYGSLAVNLIALRLGSEETVVMVTSSGPQDGKTSVSLGLAAALADLGQRVVVVECDLRRPRFADYLGLTRDGAGLSSILEGEATTDESLVYVSAGAARGKARSAHNGSARLDEGRTFGVLPCGPVPARPLALLGSPELPPLLRNLQRNSDFVLIDTPPLGAIRDAVVLVSSVDHVVLVARVGHTGRDALRRCRAAIDQLGSSLLGIVTVGGPRGAALNYYFKATRTSPVAAPPRAIAMSNGDGYAATAPRSVDDADADLGGDTPTPAEVDVDRALDGAIIEASAMSSTDETDAVSASSGTVGEEKPPTRPRKAQTSRRSSRSRTP